MLPTHHGAQKGGLKESQGYTDTVVKLGMSSQGIIPLLLAQRGSPKPPANKKPSGVNEYNAQYSVVSFIKEIYLLVMGRFQGLGDQPIDEIGVRSHHPTRGNRSRRDVLPE